MFYTDSRIIYEAIFAALEPFRPRKVELWVEGPYAFEGFQTVVARVIFVGDCVTHRLILDREWMIQGVYHEALAHGFYEAFKDFAIPYEFVPDNIILGEN